MNRTRKRATNKSRFYCNINARREGHTLKDATIEEIKWIFRIYQEDEENNFFLADPKHYQKLISFAKNARSDPEMTITKEKMIKKYFAQFDVANAKKWNIFQETYPDYNPDNYNFELDVAQIQMKHLFPQWMMTLK